MSHAFPYSFTQALGSLELIDGCGIGVQHHLLDRGRWMISPIFLEHQIVWTLWKFVNIEVWYSLFTEWGRQQKHLTFRGCNLPTAKTHQKLSPAPRHCKFSSLFVKLLPRASNKNMVKGKFRFKKYAIRCSAGRFKRFLNVWFRCLQCSRSYSGTHCAS